MSPYLALGRRQLADFVACQRRFQLRHVQQLVWPAAPLAESITQARQLGQQFHQLLERHFLGLPVADDLTAAEEPLPGWWAVFQQQGPTLPAGRRLPEVGLTVPVGRTLLSGRFDLLILGEDSAYLYDWKTETRPRPAAELAEDWQTRLYLALLTEGGAALRPDGQPLDPDHLTMTYWYVREPAATVTLSYSQAQHATNWASIQALVEQIDQQLASQAILPLTDDWTECGRCAYAAYCRRTVTAASLDEWEVEWNEPALEPDLL
ncbi:MAG: PD-(D/E)XK nuclease family protein [Chloroflexota bacterium]